MKKRLVISPARAFVLLALVAFGTAVWLAIAAGNASDEADTFYSAKAGMESLCTTGGCGDPGAQKTEFKEMLVANLMISRANAWYARLSAHVEPSKTNMFGLIVISDSNASYLACRFIVGGGADVTMGGSLLVNGHEIDYEHQVVNHCKVFGSNDILLRS